jgi:hypothetical protein
MQVDEIAGRNGRDDRDATVHQRCIDVTKYGTEPQ